MKNKWQMEYRNIRQGSTEMVDAYAARFRKVISKAEMGNLLPAQMQVMDFVAGLQPELAIITNGSNPADLNEAEEIAKNVESASLIIVVFKMVRSACMCNHAEIGTDFSIFAKFF